MAFSPSVTPAQEAAFAKAAQQAAKNNAGSTGTQSLSQILKRQNNLGWVLADQNNQYANDTYGNTQAGLAAQGQGVGANLSQQLAGFQNSATQNALSQNTTQGQQALLQEQSGLAGKQYGLTQANYQNQLAQLQQQYGLSQAEGQQSADASGTLGTQGYGQGLSNLQATHGFNQSNIQNAMQGAALSYQGQQAQFQQQAQSLANQMLGLQSTGQNIALQPGFANQQAQSQYGVLNAQGAEALNKNTDTVNQNNNSASANALNNGAQLAFLSGMVGKSGNFNTGQKRTG